MRLYPDPDLFIIFPLSFRPLQVFVVATVATKDMQEEVEDLSHARNVWYMLTRDEARGNAHGAAVLTEIKCYSTSESSSPSRRHGITNFTFTSASTGGTSGGSTSGGSTIRTLNSSIPLLNPSKIVAGILLNRVLCTCSLCCQWESNEHRIPVLSGCEEWIVERCF